MSSSRQAEPPTYFQDSKEFNKSRDNVTVLRLRATAEPIPLALKDNQKTVPSEVRVVIGRKNNILEGRGQVWTSLDEFGRVWTSLDEFGRV
jgi:hypothetical protein